MRQQQQCDLRLTHRKNKMVPKSCSRRCKAPRVRFYWEHCKYCICQCLWGALGGRDSEWEAGPPAAGEACLVVQPWWLEHLDSGVGGGPGPYPGALPGPASWPPEAADAEGGRTLRWIYGAVVNAAAAEVPALCPPLLHVPGFLCRQLRHCIVLLLPGPRPCLLPVPHMPKAE